jgi:predicted RNA-binding protein
MCQITAVLEKAEQLEKIMEGVTLVEVLPEGLQLTTFFEEPKLVPGAHIKKIDFLSGIMTLSTDKWEGAA